MIARNSSNEIASHSRHLRNCHLTSDATVTRITVEKSVTLSFKKQYSAAEFSSNRRRLMLEGRNISRFTAGSLQLLMS